jgi:hypothetical protein
MNLKDPRTRTFGLFWGAVLAVCLIAALTAISSSRFSKGIAVPIAFAGALALGPLAEVLVRRTGNGSLLVTVTIIAMALIPAHVLRPSKWTFFLTCCGIELWILTAWVILLMLD